MKDCPPTLFEKVRAACEVAVWSRGVDLQRAGAVLFEREREDEVLFRVATRGGMIGRAVTLFTDDDEWDCECGAESCEHLAAAVIAWRRAGDSKGGPAAATRRRGRVGYRFETTSSRLALRRVIVTDTGEEPLVATLAAIASARVDGPEFVAAQADLAVELLLGTHRRGPVPARLVPKLFGALSSCPDVTLDGRPVRTGPDPVLPRVRVTDQGNGFRLRLAADPAVTRSWSNGVALCLSLIHI